MNRRKAIAAVISFLLFAAVSAGIFSFLKQPSAKARVAIVLDDWGNNYSDLALLYAVRCPVTIAVLPNLTYSRRVSENAARRGCQVILHLPLESEGNRNPEKDTIYCSMGEEEIRQRLVSLLKSVPGIRGVNNHQGSRATQDERVMATILGELKKENLFFLDSMTSGSSIGVKAAASIGVRRARRDVFLDIPPVHMDEAGERAYIRNQLSILKTLALKRGRAIGIGHDRKTTLRVLAEAVPLLKKEGIRFVFLSELVE